MRKLPIGYAVSREEAYCVELPFDEFISLSKSLCLQANTPRIFHGLKRIWEFLDERGLHTDANRDNYIDINNITDTKLLAHLLDPDSAPEVEFGEFRLQEHLTPANPSARCLGMEHAVLQA